MVYNKLIVTLSLFSFFIANSQEKKKTFKESFKSSLVVESDVSYEFDSQQLQKSELILKPEFSYKLNKNIRFVLKGQIYNEFNDNLEEDKPRDETVSEFTKRLFIGDRTTLELREFYLNTKLFKKLRVTLGKQQIVWGQTDGLKLLDIVNPQNFREFVLDEFEDSRIPLWSLKTEFNIKDIGVQLIWIPDNSYHIMQDFNAPFFTKSLFQSPSDGILTQLNKIQKPDKFIKDSDVGIRLSTFTKGWDLTLNYFYYFEDLPVFYTNLQFSEIGESLIAINPKYERQQLIGGTFNKVFGSSTFRGEIAYVFDQNFSSINPNTSQGIETSDVYKSAIGLDYIKGENVISVQLFSDIIIDDISPLNRDKFESNTSLLLSRELLNDNLKIETLWVQNLNHSDGFIRPKVSYWLNSNTQLFLTSDLFYGNKSKLFGQFNKRNRISFGFKWGI